MEEQGFDWTDANKCMNDICRDPRNEGHGREQSGYRDPAALAQVRVCKTCTKRVAADMPAVDRLRDCCADHSIGP